jgi:hypothetical protein
MRLLEEVIEAAQRQAEGRQVAFVLRLRALKKTAP